MNGGHEFFSSLFGEFLVGRDCREVLENPNADPLDKEVCSSLLQFEKQLKGEYRPHSHTHNKVVDSDSSTNDPQMLRDEILHGHQAVRDWSQEQSTDSLLKHRKRPDTDLDGKVTGDDLWGRSWHKRKQPETDHYSSSTTIIITQRPDGTYEERHITKDSQGKEKMTTRIMDNENKPFYKRLFNPKKS